MFQFGTAPIFAKPLVAPGSALATPSGPQRLGVMQDIDIDLSQKLVDLFGQNKFPEDTAPSDMKITGKAAFAALEIEIYNALLFADTVSSGSDYVIPSEVHILGGILPGGITAAAIHSGDAGTGFAIGDTLTCTVGGTGLLLTVATVSGGAIATFTITKAGGGYTSGSGTALTIVNSATGAGPVEADLTASVAGTGASVTVTNGSVFVDDLGVQYAGVLIAPGYMTPVTGAPTVTGTYQPGAEGVGTYNFAPGDSGKTVLISYAASSENGFTLEITQHLQGYGPIFETWLMEPYQGNNGLYLASCRTTKMGKPMKRAGYEISAFEFEAFASATQVGANGQPLVARFFQITS
jgi:hypothetical protein